MDISSSINGNNTREIVFLDLETTVPKITGQRFQVLEFGAIVVCPLKLIELESYCTLIRPAGDNLLDVPMKSGRIGGITREAVARAPPFEEVASKIFSLLDGRIWAGHNIQRFDCVRIREAFADVSIPPPVPAGIIDSLGVLTRKFGRRAGNMKMATLASYFGLGEQKHRSLEDARMNLEVLKHCATILLLESSLPPTVLNDGQTHNSCSITTRSRTLQQSIEHKWSSRGKSRFREETTRKSLSSTSAALQRIVPYAKMDARMKKLLCSANRQHMNNLLNHVSRP